MSLSEIPSPITFFLIAVYYSSIYKLFYLGDFSVWSPQSYRTSYNIETYLQMD